MRAGAARMRTEGEADEDRMICPNCNTDNRSGARYCDGCGAELPTVAPLAQEMFGEAKTVDLSGAQTRKLASREPADASSTNPTIELSGLDTMVDSSFMPGGQAQSSAQKSYFAGDAARSQAHRGVPESKPPRPPMGAKARTIALCVLGVLIAAAALAGVTYMMQLWGGKVVPDVVGQQSQDAKAVLEEAGFAVEVSLVKSDELEDMVLACEPGAGSRIEEGATVRLDVATPRLVPDLVGKHKDEAQRLLTDEGFTDVAFTEAKSNEPEGSVLKVTPEAGTRAKANASITVEFAIPFRVPEVKGLKIEEATALLEQEGYVVETAFAYAEDVEEGLSAGCDPAPGSALASGSTVVLQVAKHRSSELIDITRTYLQGLSKVKIDGKNYEVGEIRGVTYQGGGQCAYSIVARQYETHKWLFGDLETRYGNYETINGTITWNDANQITAMNPKIEQA